MMYRHPQPQPSCTARFQVSNCSIYCRASACTSSNVVSIRFDLGNVAKWLLRLTRMVLIPSAIKSLRGRRFESCRCRLFFCFCLLGVHLVKVQEIFWYFVLLGFGKAFGVWWLNYAGSQLGATWF
jgi:hypothetical protein